MSEVTSVKKFTDFASPVVAVHDSPHHTDDVFCVTCVKIIQPNSIIIRTRNQEELEKADFCIDVGGKYDPSTGRYDHHQIEFNERYPSPNPNKYETGPKLAGFGLIWRHYGMEVISNVLNKYKFTNTENSCILFIYNQITKSLVTGTDAIDNGEQRLYYIDSGVYRCPSIIRFIQNYNPSPWVESVTDPSVYFNEAVDIATRYIIREIIKCYSQYMAKDVILEKVENVKDNGILMLDEYLPWSPIFSQFPEKTQHVNMVIFPSSDGWMFQTPYYNYKVDTKFSPNMGDGEKRKWRYPAPKHICGQSSNELIRITRVPDVLFVHTNGFLGTCKSKNGAISMANYIINNQG